MRTPVRSRLFSPAFVALAIAELAYFLAAGMTIPLTPLFAEGPLGSDAVGTGLAIGAFSVTALVLRPVAGPAADRWGRRPLLIGGALLCAAAFAAHTVASSLGVLIGLRLVLGIAEAFFFVAAFAALADLAPPGRAGEALSFNSLSLYLGIAVGPLLGEWLLNAGGFGLAWWGTAALAAAAALLSLMLPETGERSSAAAPSIVLFHPAAVGPGLALFAGIAAMSGFLGFVAIHARDVGMDGSGSALLLFGLAVVGCRVVFASLPDRVPPFRLGTAALAVTAIGMGVVGVVVSVPGLLVGAVVMGVGVAFITPALFAAILVRVSPGERGAAMGTMSLFIDLAFGAGPIMVGTLAGASSLPVGFLAAAVVSAIGALASATFLLRRPHTAPAG
jgi:MFS family permease